MLTARQMCILLPSRGVGVDADSVVRAPTKRCLFGRSDPAETQKLYEETMKNERERFLNRYNFDVLTSRFVSRHEEKDVHEKKHIKSPERLRQHSRSKRASPYEKQSRITDYWKERRYGVQENKSKCVKIINVDQCTSQTAQSSM